MTDREKLMRKIQVCDFTVFETALYLDTHKNDVEALAFYKKHLAHSKALRSEYSEKYGPLTIADNQNDKVWEWVTDKWPWEYGSEV